MSSASEGGIWFRSFGNGLAWDIHRERAMHIAVHLDIRPLNGAIHVLHSRAIAYLCEVAKRTFHLVCQQDSCV